MLFMLIALVKRYVEVGPEGPREGDQVGCASSCGRRRKQETPCDVGPLRLGFGNIVDFTHVCPVFEQCWGVCVPFLVWKSKLVGFPSDFLSMTTLAKGVPSHRKGTGPKCAEEITLVLPICELLSVSTGHIWSFNGGEFGRLIRSPQIRVTHQPQVIASL